MKAGIFYGSTTGYTESAAEEIATLWPDAQLTPISDAQKSDLEACDVLILGVSTWGIGDVQDEWDDALKQFKEANLSGKKVAIFGLGDQVGYADSFVDAMGVLYDASLEAGATCVGMWPTSDYDFDASTAVREGVFVGLPLDEHNQSDLSEQRMKDWIAQIKDELK